MCKCLNCREERMKGSALASWSPACAVFLLSLWYYSSHACICDLQHTVFMFSLLYSWVDCMMLLWKQKRIHVLYLEYETSNKLTQHKFIQSFMWLPICWLAHWLIQLQVFVSIQSGIRTLGNLIGKWFMTLFYRKHKNHGWIIWPLANLSCWIVCTHYSA